MPVCDVVTPVLSLMLPGGAAFLGLLADAAGGGAGALALAARVIHLLSAIALGGAVFYLLLVYVPARRALSPEQLAANHAALRGRLAALVGGTAALLLITGLTTYVLNVRQYKMEPSYHMLFTAKFLLALGVMLIMSLIAGRTAAAERFREKLGLWVMVAALAVVGIVVIASLMRLAPRPPKPQPAPAAARANLTPFLSLHGLSDAKMPR